MKVDINALTQFFQNECNRENSNSNDKVRNERKLCNESLKEEVHSLMCNDNELDLQLDVITESDPNKFVEKFFK